MRYKIAIGLLIVSLTLTAFSCIPNAEDRAVKEYIGYTTSELWDAICEQAGPRGINIETIYYAESGERKYGRRRPTATSADIYSAPEYFAVTKFKKWKWNRRVGYRRSYFYVASFDSENIVTDIGAFRAH